jgi:hypothetical protein
VFPVKEKKKRKKRKKRKSELARAGQFLATFTPTSLFSRALFAYISS